MKYFCFALFLLSFASSFPTFASQGMPMPECFLKGRVVSESVREEAGKGLSDGMTYTYHDVVMEIVEHDYKEVSDKGAYGGATAVGFCGQTGIQTFQLAEEGGAQLPGKCIQGTPHFMADGNMRSGNFLSNIEILDDSACSSAK